MFRTIAFLVVIMCAAASFVNADASTSDVARLRGFIDRVIQTGFDNPILPNIGRALKLPGDMPAKADGTDPEEAQDSADRNCFVVTDGSKQAKPVCLVFKATYKEKREASINWVKLGLDGKPELVMVETGRNDEAGKPIRGSGTAKYLDLKSKEAKAILQYELDFWLRNMHRTKLGKLRLTNPKATAADVKATEAMATESHRELNAEESGAADNSAVKASAEAPTR